MNIDIDPDGFDPLVCCDRSHRQHHSPPQGGSYQLDRAGVSARGIIPAVDRQRAIANADIGPAIHIANLYPFASNRLIHWHELRHHLASQQETDKAKDRHHKEQHRRQEQSDFGAHRRQHDK
jgi:hypothetical protein